MNKRAAKERAKGQPNEVETQGKEYPELGVLSITPRPLP